MFPLEHYTKGPTRKMRQKRRKMRENADRIPPPSVCPGAYWAQHNARKTLFFILDPAPTPGSALRGSGRQTEVWGHGDLGSFLPCSV